jgi:hypothetical protein
LPAPRNPAVRSNRASVAVLTSWARTPDRSARTAPAREANWQKYLKQARELAPEGASAEDIEYRADCLRRADMKRLALASAKARRARKLGVPAMTGPHKGRVPALAERRDSNPHQRDQLDQDLDLTDEATATHRLLMESPTLGAIRRRSGHTDELCEEARVLFALELVYEAQRRVLFDRLDGVMQFVACGADPDQIIRRLERLVDDYHGRVRLEAAA